MSIERELLKRVISGDNKGDFFISYDLYKDIETFLDQPESTQEPEAWILEDKKTGYRRQSAYKPTVLDKEAYEVIPLYTAPPKRNPLSYEHLEALADEFEGCPMTLGRAVEMAHGIGGEE